MAPVTSAVDLTRPLLKNFTDTSTNTTYLIVPECVPTANYEDQCFDGVDNDCDGQVDRLDVDCGLFPVLYTPRELAWSGESSLHNSANTAFLAMVYSGRLTP